MDALVAGVLTISLAFTGVSVSLLYSSYNFVPQGVEPAEYVTVLRDRDDPRISVFSLVVERIRSFATTCPGRDLVLRET